jgi:hypothetical protein
MSPRLFSPGSFWNTPLDPNPILDANSEPLAAWFASWADPAQGSPPPWISWQSINRVKATDPVQRVTLVGNGADDWSWTTAFPFLSDLRDRLWAGVPLPAAPITDTNDNAFCVLIEHGPWTDSPVDYVELYQTGIDPRVVSRDGTTGGRFAVGGGLIYDIAAHSGTAQEHPMWFSRASKFPYIAGTVMIEELWAGRVPHKIGMIVPRSRNGWHDIPALATDSRYSPVHDGEPYGVTYGTRYFVDPAFVLPAGQPPFTRTMVKAMQGYGMVPTDQSNASMGFQLEAPDDYIARYGKDPYREMCCGHPPIFRTSDTPRADGSYALLDTGAAAYSLWWGDKFQVERRHLIWRAQSGDGA